jgi:nicotinamidase/pyrazinamidase
MTKLIIPGGTDILLILDLQNDFCAGGALAVPGGDEIVHIINNIAGHFAHVLLTQDWHAPAGPSLFRFRPSWPQTVRNHPCSVWRAGTVA